MPGGCWGIPTFRQRSGICTSTTRNGRARTFPHYNPALRVHQPDYERWKSVEIAMGRSEAVALLGRPLRDPYVSPASAIVPYADEPSVGTVVERES
jgi:hypothetical protein